MHGTPQPQGIALTENSRSPLKRRKQRIRLTHRLAILIIMSVMAVAVSGFYAGATLIRQVAELSNDASLVEALMSGKKAIVELNRTRQAWAEQAIHQCLEHETTQRCMLGDNTIEFFDGAGELAMPDAIQWTSEQEATVPYNGRSYRVKVSWESIKPSYDLLTSTLQTREHLAEIFPDIGRSPIKVFGGMIVVIGSLSCAIAVMYGRRFTKGINMLIASTQAIGVGETRFEPSLLQRNDEVGILARALQRMAISLEKTRRKLIHSEKMASWQNVARKIAHEIKNPLTPISLVGAELGRRANQTTEPLKTFLEDASKILAEEIASLNRMVKDFTQFARLPVPQLKKEDFAVVVQDFITRTRRDDGPMMSFKGKVSAPTECDKGMIHQILFNLSNNAALAKYPERVHLEFNLREDNENWVLDVTDNGPGVPESIRDTLFDAYVTTRSTGDGEKGMGLGLAISRKIAMDHEGSLVLTQTSSRGSVFTLTLPKAG